MSEHAYNHVTRGTDPDEQVAVTTGGLTVEKSAELYDDDVAKVVFTVRSDTDERRMLHLADEVPEGIDAETVGFHPDYQPEHWRVSDDGRVVYESAVEPGASFETIYGVRIDSAEELSLFREEPSVEALPLVSGEPGAAEPPGRPPEVTGSTGDADTNGSKTAVPDSHASRESVVAAFVEALRRGEISDDERDRLVEALDLDPSPSLDVRVQHLQNEVDGLIAYKEALEAFIDENGSGEQILARLQADMAEQRTEIEALEETMESLEDELLTVRQSLESTTADHDGRIRRLDDRLGDLDAARDASLAAVEEEVHELRDELEREREWRQNLRGAIDVEPTPFEYQ